MSRIGDLIKNAQGISNDSLIDVGNKKILLISITKLCVDGGGRRKRRL